MTSGPNIPDAQRKSPKLTGVTLPQDVAAALAAYIKRTGESKSAVVTEALRMRLGLDVGHGVKRR